jgi:predicted anti-sigma-YlaC factor YlaD
MTCEELLTYLSDYIDHNLDEALTAAAQEHLRTCPNCRVVLDSTQQTILLYREQNQRQHIPADRSAALYDQIAKAFTNRTSTSDEDSENL